MKASYPTISVVITTRDRPWLLRRAVASVAAQSVSPVEVIVVDDASADPVAGLEEAFPERPIRVVRNLRSLGSSASRNRGVSEATGEFVAFLDDDDEWVNTKLSRQLAALDGADDTMSVCYSQVLEAAEGRRRVLPSRGLGAVEPVSEYLFVRGGLIQTSTLLLPRALASSVRWSESHGEHTDYAFAIDLQTAGASFVFVSEPLVIWHADGRDDRMSRTDDVEASIGWIADYGDRMSSRARAGFEVLEVVPKLMRTGGESLRVARLLSGASTAGAIGGKDRLALTAKALVPPPAKRLGRKVVARLSQESPTEEGLEPLRRRVKRSGNWAVNRVVPPSVSLLYHRVASVDSDPYQLSVSPEIFRQQMEALRSQWEVVPFGADPSEASGPSVSVTFDDGYADNYRTALPILEAYGIPATFFISPGYVASQDNFWWDLLAQIIRVRSGGTPELIELEVAGKRRSIDIAAASLGGSPSDMLHVSLKNMTVAEREEALTMLGSTVAANNLACAPPLSKDELVALASHPLAQVGAHTMDHPCLSSIPPDEQWQQISDSRRVLENWLERPVDLFAYPFGNRGDFDEHSIASVKRAGFRFAAANYPGVVRPWTDPLQVPRHLIRDWDGDLFRRILASLFTR